MLRFLCFLFNKPYETCKSCETLKQQLEYERSDKKQLTETLLAIVHPKPIEATPVEFNPVIQSSGIFNRRRSALEAADREQAKIIRESKNLGRPDIPSPRQTGIITDIGVEGLEKELGVEEEVKNG